MHVVVRVKPPLPPAVLMCWAVTMWLITDDDGLWSDDSLCSSISSRSKIDHSSKVITTGLQTLTYTHRHTDTQTDTHRQTHRHNDTVFIKQLTWYRFSSKVSKYNCIILQCKRNDGRLLGHWTSLKLAHFGTYQKPVCMNNTNECPISDSFQVITVYWLKFCFWQGTLLFNSLGWAEPLTLHCKTRPQKTRNISLSNGTENILIY